MREPTKCYWKIIKFPCEMSFVAIMNRSLYYSKIIFRVIQTMAKIVNNEFQVNVMNKIEAFGYVLKRRQTFFYTSNNIVKCIESPQVAGSRDQCEFRQI